MSVSNYTPSIDNGCVYSNGKLNNVVYFVSKAHLKEVHIDNGHAYIDGLTEAPTRLDCFNIQFEENETLDERYKFTKSLRFSVNGYVDASFFTGSDLFYAIIKTDAGTPYMVNVDFPSRITYTYNLSENVDQTDFTFSSQSNFPSLEVATDINMSNICKGYKSNGLDSLELIEKQYAAIIKSDNTARLYATQGKELCQIDYMKGTCSLTETFDGEKIIDTITFDIGFDNYKTSWHYNLLEFLDNIYAAKITPKNHLDELFVGFGLGLRPSYSITANDSNNQFDKITITLTSSSNRGLLTAGNYNEIPYDTKTWQYVDWVGDIKAYECAGDGKAIYLLKQEIDGLGNPTGRYMAYTGWSQYFADMCLNIVGEFDTKKTFYTTDCGSTRWSFLNHYYCIDGFKIQAIEEEMTDDGGETWIKTGVTKLGKVVEDTDNFCDQEATYDWRQSIKWQCGT